MAISSINVEEVRAGHKQLKVALEEIKRTLDAAVLNAEEAKDDNQSTAKLYEEVLASKRFIDETLEIVNGPLEQGIKVQEQLNEEQEALAAQVGNL